MDIKDDQGCDEVGLMSVCYGNSLATGSESERYDSAYQLSVIAQKNKDEGVPSLKGIRKERQPTLEMVLPRIDDT